jgi:ABC-2 type transport system ATP-binding protein
LTKYLLALAATLLLAACGSSEVDTTIAQDTGAPRAGVSTDQTLASDVDGAAIAFTVHEPRQVVPGAKFPLVLQSHGYGGSRTAASGRPAEGGASAFARLLDAGYGVISIDERGFGQSGGKVRVLDPYYEGQDLLQIVDWAEANLDWLAYRDGNVLMGAIGGSYGGGFQHLIYAIDPKHRLDAIVPDITWHDLRYSLYSGNTFKSYWAPLLSAVGNSKGGQDDEVNQGLAEGLATNNLSDERLALLYQNSLVSYCNGDNPYAIERLGNAPLTPIDAMYWQGIADTLFNLNEEQKNYQCLKALGGDVRLLTKNQGHDTAGAGGDNCGALNKEIATVDWFDEKLKGVAGRASYIPEFCYHLDGSAADGVVTTTLPQPNQSFTIPPQLLVAESGSQQSVSIPLMTAGPNGAIVAGVPTIHLSMTDPAGANAGDPIVFMILAKRAAGATADTELQPNEVRPFRGFTAGVDDELVGVSNRLAAGDELRLVIYAAHAARYPSSGSKVATPVQIEGTVSVPVLPADLPAPPSNQ